MNIGEILKRSRLIKGYTQEQMAEKMHMSRENISKLERGKIEIKFVDAIRWFQITDMPQVTASLICGVDPQVLANFLDQVSAFAQLVGAFILPIFGGEFVYVERHQ